MTEPRENSLLGKIAAYTEILSKDPRSTIFVSLSECYRKMGMLGEAKGVAEKGLAALPDYCPGHVVLARIRCQQGDLVGSEESFGIALEIDPSSLAALVGFSRVLLLQNRQTEARELLLRARNLSPADPVINKLLLGIPAHTAVVETPPVRPEPLSVGEPARLQEATEPVETVTLAELYLKQGLSTKALSIYRNLLNRDPDNLELRRRIRDIEAPTPPESKSEEDFSKSRSEVAAASGADHVGAEILASKGLSVVDQLNRLLLSIQKRRGDV